MISPVAKTLALLMFLGMATARSQTLNWASLTQSDIVDSYGDALDNTFVIQLGAFTEGFEPDTDNIGSWSTNWRVFDTADYSYSPEQLGYFTGTMDVQDVPSYSSLFAGLKAYIWIRNSSDTEYFLASTSSGKWEFPALDPDCCPNGEVTTWSVSDLNTDSPVWGAQLGIQGGGESTAPSYFDIQTHAVPEPTFSLLLLLGSSFVMIRRRRTCR